MRAGTASRAWTAEAPRGRPGCCRGARARRWSRRVRHTDPAAGGLGSAEEEEPEEELDEEERRLLAERETQRRAQDAREAEMRSEVVDFF